MADITNPIVVKFSNERARVFADALLQAIETAEALDDEWNSNAMATLIPNTADVIVDGSATDGRYPSTGAKVNAVRSAAVDLKAWGAQGTPTRKERLRTFAVNGTSRF
jgi:hypothetical protein